MPYLGHGKSVGLKPVCVGSLKGGDDVTDGELSGTVIGCLLVNARIRPLSLWTPATISSFSKFPHSWQLKDIHNIRVTAL